MGELTGLVILLLIAVVVTIVILSVVVARDAVRPPRHTAGYALARRLPTDPGELNLSFESWTLDLDDGAFLPVWEIEGQGERVTAVLVHDWGQSRIDMLTNIEPWTRSCRRVVLYDLRGHGETQGGGSRMGCGEHSDLLTLLDRLGGGPFVLVGHGLGGVISLAAEANATDAEIAGVAVAEPYSGLRVWLTNRLRSSRCPTALRAPALLWLRLAGIRDPGTAEGQTVEAVIEHCTSVRASDRTSCNQG